MQSTCSRVCETEGIPLRRLDLGGGFGVRYLDEPRLEAEALARLVRRMIEGLDCELLFEPGRALVAEAGVIVSSGDLSQGGRRASLPGPGLRDARPDPAGDVRRPSSGPAGTGASAEDEPLVAMDVVGPICESSDVLGRDRLLPELTAGDLVAITGAGAYGAVMASAYNSRPSAAEVLVDGERFAVIRPSLDIERQFADEQIPDWLRHGADG